MKHPVAIFFLMTIFIFTGLCEDDSAGSDQIQSITAERRDILQYGIDSQIITLLDDITKEKNDSFTVEATDLFSSSLNSKVKLAVLTYFLEIEHYDAADIVFHYLETFDEESIPADVMSSGIRYISQSFKDPDNDILDFLKDLCRDEDENISRNAIEALGNYSSGNNADFLLDLYEDSETTDIQKSYILTSLGKMKAKKALDMISEILENEDEERSLRWRACQALGDIGDEKSLPSIKLALSSDDTYLRSYAVGALKSFSGDEVENLLIEALKDSFWRVRVSAAETLGSRKSEASVPILIFKAKKDPEANVRIAAIKALGEIRNSESLDFIRSCFTDKKTEMSVRLEVTRILIENDLTASLEIIEKVLSENWDESDSPMANAIGKYLSQTENGDLEVIFERMLSHPKITMRIYAIRGIGKNKYTSLKSRIEELSGEDNPPVIRKEALAALEQF